MYKYYRINTSTFNKIYPAYLCGRVFYRTDNQGYIIITANKKIQEVLLKIGTEITIKPEDNDFN